MRWIPENIRCPPEAARAVPVIQVRERTVDDLLGRGDDPLEHCFPFPQLYRLLSQDFASILISFLFLSLLIKVTIDHESFCEIPCLFNRFNKWRVCSPVFRTYPGVRFQRIRLFKAELKPHVCGLPPFKSR